MTPTIVVVAIPAGQAVTVFAAPTSAAKRWFRNRGPGDATFRYGTPATGSNEPQLLAGERHDEPFRSALPLSVFSAAGTTIEGESWS